MDWFQAIELFALGGISLFFNLGGMYFFCNNLSKFISAKKMCFLTYDKEILVSGSLSNIFLKRLLASLETVFGMFRDSKYKYFLQNLILWSNYFTFVVKWGGYPTNISNKIVPIVYISVCLVVPYYDIISGERYAGDPQKL